MKKLCCLLLCLCLLLPLCACAGANAGGRGNNGAASAPEDPGTKPVSAATDAPAPSGEHEPITICGANMVYKGLADALKEKYPEIRLEIVSYSGANMSAYMKQSLLHGDIPDIFSTTYFFEEAAQQDYLLDLSGYGFVNNYSDAMLRGVNVDGGVYLLPSYYNLYGIYYNKTVFDRQGWDVPESFEELLALQDKAEEAGIDLFRSRMDLNGYVFTYLFGLGNTLYFDTPDGDRWKKDFLTGQANAAGNLEPVLEYFRRWIDAGFIDAGDIGNNSSNPAFMGGLAAMHLCTTYNVKAMDWSLREDHSEYGLQEYGIIPYLSEDGSSNMLISNVQRYYGLSKALAEPGNEQKLADALKVMEFLSTSEGSNSLGATGSSVLSTLTSSKISEDSFYYEVREAVSGGQLMPHTWAGWEEIINPMADTLHAFVRGERTVAEVCAEFDRIRDDYLQNGYAHFAVCREDLTVEETARLLGAADLRAADADAALVSLPGFYGFAPYPDREGYQNMENRSGAVCGVYGGMLLGVEEVNMLRQPTSKLAVAELTGREIRDIAAAGKLLYPEVDGRFDYVLTTRGDMELADDEVYRLVFASGDVLAIPEEQITTLDPAEISPASALTAYLTELGEFTKADING